MKPDKAEYLRKAKIIERMPCIFRSDEHRPFPADMAGAKLIAIGTVEDRRAVEGGGLLIDYQPVGSTDVKRIVLAFTEEAMWLIEEFSRPSDPCMSVGPNATSDSARIDSP